MNGKGSTRKGRNLTMVVHFEMREVKQTMCVTFAMNAEIWKLNCFNKIRLMNKSGKFQ